MITFDEFINKWKGRYLDFDGRYGYQCVDLMRQYIKEVLQVNPYEIKPAGTAKQIYRNFTSSPHFIKIPNTPTGVPKKGDIIFWGTYPFVTGFAGHVALFVEGNVMSFISFDQNWPTGTSCHLQKHSYRGVMGWISPK